MERAGIKKRFYEEIDQAISEAKRQGISMSYRSMSKEVGLGENYLAQTRDDAKRTPKLEQIMKVAEHFDFNIIKILHGLDLDDEEIEHLQRWKSLSPKKRAALAVLMDEELKDDFGSSD